MFEVVDMGSFGQIIEEIEAAPELDIVRVKYALPPFVLIFLLHAPFLLCPHPSTLVLLFPSPLPCFLFLSSF